MGVAVYYNYQEFDKYREKEAEINLVKNSFLSPVLSSQRNYKTTLQQNKAVLRDEEIYNFFSAEAEDKLFIKSSTPAFTELENSPHIFQYRITVTNEIVVYDRTDYSLLQFIGDVGALQGTLQQVFALLIPFVFNLGWLLDAYIIKSVFRTSKLTSTEKLDNEYPTNPFVYLHTCFCRSAKYKRVKHIGKVAMRRIERELDVVHFLKK